MAMIKCIECGKEISSSAVSCPYCGHKTRYAKEQEDQKGSAILLYIGIVVLLVGIILFCPAFITLLGEYDDWYFWNWNSSYAKEVVSKVSIGTGMIAGGAYCLFFALRKNRDIIKKSKMETMAYTKSDGAWKCTKCSRYNSGTICQCGMLKGDNDKYAKIQEEERLKKEKLENQKVN